MRSTINTAHGILIDHSPCLADDVPLDGLAEAIAAAIKAERERCAAIAESFRPGFCGDDKDVIRYDLAEAIAKQIRSIHGQPG